jgi:cytochrome P450
MRWLNTGLDNSASGPGKDIGQHCPVHEQLHLKRVFARSLLFLEGQAHRRLRDTMSVGFKPDDIQPLAPAIAAMADRLIAGMMLEAGDCRSVDFVERFARPLPVLVISRLMGMPADPPAAFKLWAADIADFIGSPIPDSQQTTRALQALAHMCEFFSPMLNPLTLLPQGGVLNRIAQAYAQQRITRVEALAQCCTLLFAGYETTRHLLANGLLALLQHPCQWAALKAEPTQLRRAIDEMLRYDSPVQYTGRRLLADVEIRGQRLCQGDLAILHIGAANRDPLRFSQPQRFDIERNEGRHLSFGRGPHVCIGAALTQLQAEIAFSALMRTMPAMTLEPGAEIWQSPSAYRVLARLPILCGNLKHA